VNYDNSLVVTTTVTRYLCAQSSGDHSIYMWRHLQGLLAWAQCWQTTSVHPRVLRFFSWLCSCALAQHSFTRFL